jgi:hypothetical protein
MVKKCVAQMSGSKKKREKKVVKKFKLIFCKEKALIKYNIKLKRLSMRKQTRRTGLPIQVDYMPGTEADA